jgi:hypothetical protein
LQHQIRSRGEARLHARLRCVSDRDQIGCRKRFYFSLLGLRLRPFREKLIGSDLTVAALSTYAGDTSFGGMVGAACETAAEIGTDSGTSVRP